MQKSRQLQLYPSRITITPQREPLEFHKVKFNKQCPSFIKIKADVSVANFKKPKNPFKISKASKKKILDSINSMYVLSEPRKVKMQNDKMIYNFRMSFITLTLPSPQKHNDVEIKSNCLNQFLVEIRKAYGVQNYLWKAELQKNDNIHFHIVTDKYIDYQALRRRWNRILNKLGYIDAYREKMQALSLSDYHALRCKKNEVSFESSSLAYAKGIKHNWANPNSVDVRSVFGKKELAIYLGKYIVKKVAEEKRTKEQKARERAFGRAWFRSYSLSSLKYINKFLADEMTNLIEYLRSEKEKVLELVGDYYNVFYFSAEQLSKTFQAFHKKFIFANAQMYNYPFPHT